MKTDKYMSLWLAAALMLLPSSAYAANGAYVAYLFKVHGVSLVIASILIFGLKYFSGRRIRFMVIYPVLPVGTYAALGVIDYLWMDINNLRLIIYVSAGVPIAIILICYAFIRRKEKQKEKQRVIDRGDPTPHL